MRTLLCLICVLMLVFLISCASKQKSTEEPVTLSPTIEQRATALASIKQAKKSFFEGIDSSILVKVENGTKADLVSALSQLKRSDEDYKENEKVLIAITQDLLSILYSETVFSFSAPKPPMNNPYMAALDSARKGAYDFSIVGNDFLSLALPSLVLITAPAVQNFYEEAEDALYKALILQENSFLALFFYSLVLERSGKKDDALLYLNKAYEKDASYIPLSRLYMKILYEKGFTEKSFQVALSLLQVRANDIEALKICAQISFENKNYDAAEQYVAQIIQNEPDNTDYVLFRAKILMDKGDYIRVSSLLDLYARTNKTNKEYLILRTRLQRDWNKNTAAASNTIQEALQLYPNDIVVLLLAASLSAQSGQKIGQFTLEDLLSKILEQEPMNEEALLLTVHEHMRLQQWNMAYDYSCKMLANDKTNESLLLSHIEICIALGKLSEARSGLETLMEKTTDKETFSIAQVKLLIAEGNTVQARKLIDTMLANSSYARSKSSLYYERSRIAVSEEDILNDLRASLTSNPRNPDALFALYRFYFNKKDYRKAQYYLKQVVSLNPSDQNLLKLNEEIENLLAN